MPPRILIVDDHPDILHLLTLVLRTTYEVCTATRGDEALDQWRALQPDLVLLDINLPGLSGDEVCRQIKAASTIPVIIMTGHATTDIQASHRAPGADGYLLKPFDVMDVLEHLPRWLTLGVVR